MKTRAQLPKNSISVVNAAMAALLLVACGGGGAAPETTPTPDGTQ